jgi:hypothetical protein
MKRLRIIGLAAFAVCMFAAVGPSGAGAEALLLVLGSEAVSGLEYTGNGGEAILEDDGKKTIVCKEVNATATFVEKSGKPADSEQGKADINFRKCKKEKINCRSEISETEKDPVETILVDPGLIGSAGTKGTELRYELVNLLSQTLLINCGGVKEEVKGSVACVVTPSLAEVEAGVTVTITCTQEKGKQVSGACVEPAKACEDLKNNPFLANLGGGFKSAGELVTVKGSFNKMITLDD